MNLDKIFEATKAMLALAEKLKLTTDEWQQAQSLANAEMFHRERQTGWAQAEKLAQAPPRPYYMG
jgi:hypothetical protein